MNRLKKWFFSRNWVFNICSKIIRWRIKNDPYHLTPTNLIENDWLMDDNNYWYEPNIKERDRIWIKFGENGKYYQIYHGGDKTYMGLKSSVDWFLLYFLIMNEEKYKNE